ncbi:MAG: glutathione S-transferase family protein [Gammaproteobacteria bacterium]|nr:glutathione S-transferase family protein [Gammaproteobacteria bacterium]
MGRLVDGQWQDVWYDTESNQGRFVRKASQFRNWITKDGSPGPEGKGGFKAEPDRYHLYVSLACPWAHRTIIFRKLKGLEDLISMSVVNAHMGKDGWTFEPGPGVIADTIYNAQYMHEIYTTADPLYSGRVTVPVLWDKQQKTIVSNESSEIIRMFNTAFDELVSKSVDYYPEVLRDEIDAMNDFIYPNINNGVYRAGFATSQKAYEEACDELFAALDRLEEKLEKSRYLTGTQITEADWRLFTTLLRFDPVYYAHFKTNLRQLRDYPNLWGYVCELYQIPGIAETVDIEYTKQHYYQSQTTINPTGIVPKGPLINFDEPHSRSHL